jgi:hypothetical protein
VPISNTISLAGDELLARMLSFKQVDSDSDDCESAVFQKSDVVDRHDSKNDI